jgi:hypothetical protein
MGRSRLIVGIIDGTGATRPSRSRPRDASHWRCAVRIDRMYIDPHTGEPSRLRTTVMFPNRYINKHLVSLGWIGGVPGGRRGCLFRGCGR